MRTEEAPPAIGGFTTTTPAGAVVLSVAASVEIDPFPEGAWLMR
jgi:hypothetical protein